MSVADRDLLFLSHGLSRRGRSPALPCAGCAHLGGREKVAAGTRLATDASSAQGGASVAAE